MNIPDWNELVLKRIIEVTKLIKETEILMMKKGLILETGYKDLSWRQHGKKMRIFYQDKPLEDQPSKIRLEQVDNIQDLVLAASNNMQKMFGSFLDKNENDSI